MWIELAFSLAIVGEGKQEVGVKGFTFGFMLWDGGGLGFLHFASGGLGRWGGGGGDVILSSAITRAKQVRTLLMIPKKEALKGQSSCIGKVSILQIRGLGSVAFGILS